MSEAKNHEYHVEMTCDGCAGAVERVLNKIKDKGIQNIDISVTDKKVVVTTTLSADEILEVIKKTGKAVQYVKSV